MLRKMKYRLGESGETEVSAAVSEEYPVGRSQKLGTGDT